MAYDYGYGSLENELIALFRAGAPDFEAAEELIRKGANLNAIGKDDEENMLSKILHAYWWTETGDEMCGDCDYCDRDTGNNCERNRNPNLGQSMCAIIHFFLDHGFDVNKCNGCYGAQCLFALTLSTFDRYMIEATKILLDAGAKNRTISPNSSGTPWNFIGTEGCYQDTCEGNPSTGNIFEAVYQIYQALEDGRPYSGIDSYEVAIGKTVQKVLATKKSDQSVFFSMNLPEFKKENCYTETLYFVYNGGALITTQFADFWTDTVCPSSDLVDVSDKFDGIVGNTIKDFTFDHRSVVKGTMHYMQPITMIGMDSGNNIRFSNNFGELNKENRAAFYEIK